MGWLETTLGFAGLVMLLGGMLYWLSSPDPPVIEEDLAAPYREALHAGMRLQNAALDLEQQLYVEALRHSEDEAGASGSSEQRP